MKKSFVIGLGVAAMTLVAGSAFATEPLYFLNHNDLPDSGAISSWDGAVAMTSYQGDGVPAAGPTVEVNDFGYGAQKWSKNYSVPNVGEPWKTPVGTSWGKWTGYRVASPTAPVAINGASFVVAAIRGAKTDPGNWDSIIDVMYDKLTLGIHNDTGQIVVRRNGSVDFSTSTVAIGQSTILSMVCQADGSYEVWADGISVLSRGASGTMTEWDPNRLENKDEPDWANTATLTGQTVNGGNWDQWWAAVMKAEPTVTAAWDWTNLNKLTNKDSYWGYTAKVPDFKKFINVGRNNPDGWSAFNGSIGDVKIFGSALSVDERALLENQMAIDMGLKAAPAAVPEPGTIVAALSILGPAGMMFRRRRK